MNDQPSLLSRTSLWLGGFAFVAAVVGPLFAHFEIVAPMVGFVILAIGLLDAAIALVTGGISLLSKNQANRGPALGGIIAAMLVLGPILISASRGAGLPRINDITTDTIKPPRFTQALRLDDNKGRDMSYPDGFAEQQEAGYGKIEPLLLSASPGDAFARVYEAAKAIESWEITLADPGSRKIEGVDTTWLFRFKDDFVIEIRSDDGGGSEVHMRSKSRDGRGDVGANAARIRTFFEHVRSGSSD